MRASKGLLILVIVAAFAAAGIAIALLLPGLLDNGPSTTGGPAVDIAPDTVTTPAPGNTGGGLLSWQHILLWFGGWILVSAIVLSALAYKLLRRRMQLRNTREYDLYEVHLSMHDEAKPQDLEDMVEAVGNVVREFPEQRARDGQPFFALECHYGPGPSGMEWAICLRCEKSIVDAVEAAMQNAYPDVRIGHTHEDKPTPIAGQLRRPGHILRFRKARSFIYPISTEGDKLSSPPLEAIAAQQVGVGCPSSVRLQFIPAMDWMESWSRRKFEDRENHLLRSETWGLPEAGASSVLHSEELRESRRTQNRGLFYLELQVAADTRENANQIAAAVTARRGENRLHRRWLVARQDLYRDRFATAYPPLLPSFGWGKWPSVVSSAEVAHLLELPTARLKNVPVRRFALPRLPAPPEAARAGDAVHVELPPATEETPVSADQNLPQFQAEIA